jgi:hypothetical protein|tara:strand:- start:5177 stop:5329 length:153 start_codon:yes stop_codon:yes gene_type:complete
MSENPLTEMKSEVPESEALIDAEKTFKWTLIGAILFGLAALFIIMRTRMG